MQVFTKKQVSALEQGELVYQAFIKEVKTAVSGNYSKHIKKHWFFSSAPGYSKSSDIERELEVSKVPYYQIVGKKSMLDLGYQLCFIAANHGNSPAIVNVDDSDFMFANSDNMNIVKNLISGAHRFEYSNSGALRGLSNLPPEIKSAVNKFKIKSGQGFSVPTDNIHFVIASNIKLPTEEEAAIKQLKSPGPTGQMMMDKAAIADRLNNHHIDFQSWEENWGYVAHRILNNPNFKGGFEFSQEQRQQMVKWTWDNFNHLKSKSFRLYEGLAQEMLLNEDNYLDIWNSSKFLDLSQYKK
jgi:hypothetical protein